MMRYTNVIWKSMRIIALLGILLFGLAVSSTQQAASAPGKWDVSGPIAHRAELTATRLDDGRVLVTGGIDLYFDKQSSTELYDPITHEWSLAASMNSARSRHTATLLSDGRVLVVGGAVTETQLLSSAEIYDPTMNSWTPVASMNAGRFFHSATLLNDGRVLVIGGNQTYDACYSSAEIYNPGTNTWSSVDPMSTERCYHSATLLNDSTVLVVGGYDSDNTTLATAELFDPTTETWVATGTLNVTRSSHSATLLLDGTVLVAGGTYNSSDGTATAEIYDPVSGAWALTGEMNDDRYTYTASLLDNGLVVVAGGYSTSSGENILDKVEVFDPAAGTWRETAELSVVRMIHQAVVLDGELLVIGGYSDPYITNTAELFDVSTETWSIIGSTSFSVWEHTATLLSDGRILVAGGREYGPLGDSEYYPFANIVDPVTNLTTLVGDMVVARGIHTATLLDDGRVLVVGGLGNSGDLAGGSAEVFDPATKTWTEVGSLSNGRYGHTATRLLDGRVLVAGGSSGADSTEIFDPTSNTWSAGDSMHTPRSNHTATLLPDGRVLVAGGANQLTGATDSAEIYDPDTNTWLVAESLNMGRDYHAAILLNDGRVLVAGGEVNGYGETGDTEIFDPVTGLWTSVGSLYFPRLDFELSLLPDGRVLAAGGYSNDGNSTQGEIFDVTTDTWGFTRELNFQRITFDMVRVPDGRVLAIGGSDFSEPRTGTTNTIEVYNSVEPTITTITSDDPDPSLPGDPVTVAFQVTSGGDAPSGPVTVIASSGESCAATVAEGSCTITLGSVGEHTLTVRYDGDEGHDGSTSLAETHSVSDWGPTALNAESISDSEIDLVWTDNAEDEIAFHIERSPNGTDGWAKIDTVGVDVTSYADIDLTCGTAYFYRVRVYRDSDASFSTYSNVADATTQACVFNTSFTVYPDEGSISGWEWPVGSTVTVSVDDDGDPGNGVLYQDSQTPTPDPSYPGAGSVHFNPEPTIDLVPGQFVTMSDGTTTLTSTIQAVAFEFLDEANDIAAGTGPANLNAHVHIDASSGQHDLSITVGADGIWVANFGAGGQDLEGIYDAHIQVFEGDGGTLAYPTFPFMSVQPDDDWVKGYDWPAGRTMMLTVDDDEDLGNGFLYQDTSISGPAPWDPYQNYVEFNPEPTFDLLPGQYITLTGGAITKTVFVQTVTFDYVDEGTDTAGGTGPADGPANVCV
ncbi:MAG: Ig-like domain repeat protein [Anaerolineales bacterium]|nr:Ig-like domain repeat protein [Anaerolineales bacterium]